MIEFQLPSGSEKFMMTITGMMNSSVCLGWMRSSGSVLAPAFSTLDILERVFLEFDTFGTGDTFYRPGPASGIGVNKDDEIQE